MKSLTVTFHHSNNYGAVMQMFALHHTLVMMGHENMVLETRLVPSESKKQKIKGVKPRLRIIYIKFFEKLRKKERTKLYLSFANFKSNNVKFTRPFTSMDDLRKNAPDVDCLITGSDQVWNMTSVPSMIPSRFLDFGNKELIRFSFAASIENMNYNEEQIKYARKQLEHFKGISLREESARKFIEESIGLPAIQLLDPIFLLNKEEWLDFAIKPRINGPYILCYQVLSNKNMQKTVNRLKKETGFPIVSICNLPFKWIHSDYSFFDVSPEEFLGLINGASIVVTTSFHGTAFGILFNKPTYSLTRVNSSNRIFGIMDMFGLTDHIIDDKSKIVIRNIDWNKINQKIDKERIKSKNYLNRMLQ